MNSVATNPRNARGRLSNLSEFRLIPRVEKMPSAVSFAQTAPGKTLMLALFGCGMWIFLRDFPEWAVLLTSVSIATFMPTLRHLLLAAAPLFLVVLKNFKDPLLLSLTFGVVLAGALLYWCANRWPQSYFGRRPVAHLLSGFVAIILFASATPAHSVLNVVAWNIVGILTNYVWFIAYALLDRNSKWSDDFKLELATFRPIWGSTVTPFPKGAANLRRIEAKTSERLAIVQLKGLKLLIWAFLLGSLQVRWNLFFHDYLKIPTPVQSLTMSVRGMPFAWHVRWESQILFFFEVALRFAVTGHVFIAACRMAGFDALRNSYRPLSSTTIAEYFNRFYYYFKELLVDVFFYPTFLRYCKKHRRLRTFFATFVAIAFGNSFFHLTRDWHFIRSEGPWKALAGYQVLFFYNLLLATAVGISQMRKGDPRAKSFVRRRIVQPLGVLSFYCVLGVFGDESRLYPLGEHLKYLANLFFIRL